MNYVLNGKVTSVASEWLDESLLFTLREYHGLVGAKFGCGAGICGACTVIIDGVTGARKSPSPIYETAALIFK